MTFGRLAQRRLKSAKTRATSTSNPGSIGCHDGLFDHLQRCLSSAVFRERRPQAKLARVVESRGDG